MDLNFRQIALSDKEAMQRLFFAYPSRSCDRCFANAYLWSSYYHMTIAAYKGSYIFKFGDQGATYAYPLGPDENDAEIIRMLYEDAAGKGATFRLVAVTPTRWKELEALFPGKFTIAFDRDAFDYIYDREKLATLSGKKYHGKRNHINKFMEQHSGWTYETISEANTEACMEMAKIWRKEHDDTDASIDAELAVALKALELHEELGLIGGLLKIDGRVVAFTLGEPISDETFCVHIEKAYADVQGAYPMINQQFIQHETEGYRYINREEDLGLEGLRKAKESYHPMMLEEKGVVMIKEGETLA